MWKSWFSGNNFLEERMEGWRWIITAFPTPLQWRFFHPIKFSDFFLQIIVCLTLPMHSISGFKPNPPVLMAVQSLQKSTAQTFSKWNQLRHEMERLKESEAVKTLKLFCIFVTFNFLAMAFLSLILRISMQPTFNSVWKLLQCGEDFRERPFRYLGQDSFNW